MPVTKTSHTILSEYLKQFMHIIFLTETVQLSTGLPEFYRTTEIFLITRKGVTKSPEIIFL